MMGLNSPMPLQEYCKRTILTHYMQQIAIDFVDQIVQSVGTSKRNDWESYVGDTPPGRARTLTVPQSATVGMIRMEFAIRKRSAQTSRRLPGEPSWESLMI